MNSICLVSLSERVPPPEWTLGRAVAVAPAVEPVAGVVQQAAACPDTAALLFWDPSLGNPDEKLVRELVASPSDCWHAGLALGARGLPRFLEFVSPAWMLACDPPAEIEASSWRVSLRGCLVRAEVPRKLGGLNPAFQSLEGAALEMGHRWIRRGALMRHVPRLVHSGGSVFKLPPSAIPVEDELRFAYYCFGRRWAGWSVLRSVMTGYVSVGVAVRAWRRVMSSPRPPEPAPLRVHSAPSQLGAFTPHPRPPHSSSRVSVLVPTVDRYPYLRTLLGQLRRQTVAPLEIIVVDQTAAERRATNLREEFDDLPLRVIFQDEPGQCGSRNAGLQLAQGDFILFIDDDDEVPADLIANHLQTLERFGAEVSCGVAEEVGAGALPADFRLVRTSDVFPTNNSMLRREVLERSGLFDLAYNRAQRADGDLGMRLYLTGALMVLNPAISVLHHHAPSGGLRKHKARTVTYAMSRNQLFRRTLASASEIYLAGRYFPHPHLKEMLWQSVLGGFSVRGGFLRRLAKMGVSGLVLPGTLWELRRRMGRAKVMATRFPQIPALRASSCAGECRSRPGQGAAALSRSEGWQGELRVVGAAAERVEGSHRPGQTGSSRSDV